MHANELITNQTKKPRRRDRSYSKTKKTDTHNNNNNSMSSSISATLHCGINQPKACKRSQRIGTTARRSLLREYQQRKGNTTEVIKRGDRQYTAAFFQQTEIDQRSYVDRYQNLPMKLQFDLLTCILKETKQTKTQKRGDIEAAEP